MIRTTPLANDTAAALRQAFGPGYGFGGATSRQFDLVVRNTPAATSARRRWR